MSHLGEILGEDLEAETEPVGSETIRGTFEDHPRVLPVEGCRDVLR